MSTALAAWRNPTGLLGRNLLLENGEEVILESNGSAHWPELNTAAVANRNLDRVGEAGSPELGIFKVWSLPADQGGGSLWKRTYPLTNYAATVLANFDENDEKLVVGCDPKGMPSVMAQPYPMQFIQQGEDILLKLEEYDTERLIKMAPRSTAENTSSILGHSFGRWDGDTLVVDTYDIDWSSFDGRGIPLSDQAQLQERFRASADGSQLNYQMQITDPEVFTEPVLLERFWYWFPEMQLSAYSCQE